jgi:hypothetical protein
MIEEGKKAKKREKKRKGKRIKKSGLVRSCKRLSLEEFWVKREEAGERGGEGRRKEDKGPNNNLEEK